ncbi:MAG: DsbA family oxidoreductase [Betaproteobacteria bacterium]|nr:MAG: DsbA family oxidoreductase [Betaproteobacteria bacterium]
MRKPLTVEIVSDVICPWCYIGKRRLEKALALLGSDVDVNVRYLPFQLNPDMPQGGMPRADYRKSKFGSIERGRQLDARVAAEGRGEGIEFAFERMARTPSTLAAHRLIELAQRQGAGQAVVDELFRAYFEQAKDVRRRRPESARRDRTARRGFRLAAGVRRQRSRCAGRRDARSRHFRRADLHL